MEMLNPPHPGAIIADLCLDGNGISAEAAAGRLGVRPGRLRELLAGRCPLSAAMALKLEAAGWSNAPFWMRLQAAYERLWTVRYK